MSKLPFVSIIVVARNEINFINDCILSIIMQDYDKDLFEIILVDGVSEDGTSEYLTKAAIILKQYGFSASFYSNKDRFLAHGWNIGIEQAKGDIVCRIEAHSAMSPSYISTGVSALSDYSGDNVACVGGVLRYISSNTRLKAIGNLYSSPFGVGPSRFRIGVSTPTYSDTAVFGLYRKEIFEKIGYLNQDLQRGQDINLHSRMRKHGYRFITHPAMTISHHIRSTFTGFLYKTFVDGYWLTAHQNTFYYRHLPPLLFVFYILGLIFFTLFCNLSTFGLVIFLPLVLYCFLGLFFSFANFNGWQSLQLCFLFPCYHNTYGMGSFCGIVHRVFKFLKLNGLNTIFLSCRNKF